jgi:hypothetical protein
LIARGIYNSGDIYIFDGLFSGIESDNIGHITKKDKKDSIQELWTKLTTGNGFLAHKTVLLVEDMEGKSSSALKFEDLVKKMDKSIVFAYKGAEYGDEKERKNGIFEYDSYEEYYSKFVCPLLGMEPMSVEVKKRGSKMKDTFSFKKGKFGKLGGGGGGGIDLFNMNKLKEIGNAKDDNFNLLHRKNRKSVKTPKGAGSMSHLNNFTQMSNAASGKE